MATEFLLLCRIRHGAGRISLIPQDCVTRHVDNCVETICPEGHVVFYGTTEGWLDLDTIPNSTGFNS